MIWPPIHVNTQITIDCFYSFFEAHRDNGFHFPGETHNFWECVYLINGSICASGDDRVYALKTGEIIFHKPMELHKYFVDSASGADLLIFSFSLQGNLADSLKNKVFMLTSSQRQSVNNLLDYVRSKLDVYPASPDSLPEHQYLLPFDHIPSYPQMLTSYVYQLILSLTGNGTIAETSTAPDALLFRRAVNYLNHQLSGMPALSEIASFCNTSEATLKRTFDKYAGIGVHKYFLKLKMNAAAELLINGLSVTETAEKLGFSSQAYFSAVFKRETGINPSEIRQR